MPLNQSDLSSVDTDFDDDGLTGDYGDDAAKVSETVDTNDTDVSFNDDAGDSDVTSDAQAATTVNSAVDNSENATQSTAVAQAPNTNTGTAVAQAGASSAAMAAIQDDGFGDVDLGFGSFPIVKLQDGEFKTNEVEIGTEFQCVMKSARAKFIYKVSDEDFFYTFDKETTTKGELVADKLRVWEQGNQKVQIRNYKDVTVLMVDGPIAGQVAILSIPQTSVQRMDGYRVQLAIQGGRKLPQVVTKVKRGAKVTNAKYPFFPWDFENMGDVAQETA